MSGLNGLICIDPGPEVSGMVTYYPDQNVLGSIDPEVENHKMLEMITGQSFRLRADTCIIEMVSGMGMPVGKETFETVRWIGIFQHAYGLNLTHLIERKKVKQILCGTPAAKDKNVRQAVFDCFEPIGGGANPVVGTKKQPGPLYGLKGHAVSALAVGLAWRELRKR